MFRGQQKFKSVLHVVNGVTYHSRKEGQYSLILEQRKKDGHILSWERQRMLTFQINGILITRYKMDFMTHLPSGELELIEIKGMMLPEWKIKWRLLEAFLNDPVWRKANDLPKDTMIHLVIEASPNVKRWVAGERQVRRKKRTKAK